MAVVPTSPIASSGVLPPNGDLPRRDEEARARLRAVAAQARPFLAAGDRLLPVTGRIGELLPASGLQRGSTIAVDGSPGSGSTSVALTLAAAATAAGEWAAVVDPGGTLGARAAVTAGVELERLAVVRRVAPDRWASVVAALLDGITVVVAAVPPHLRLGDARRLIARARERKAVLVAFGAWPVEASLRVHTGRCTWSGLGAGTGLLDTRDLHIEVEGKGARKLARGMTRTCCVWCPDWPVVAARRRDESLRSVPVVVRERIGSREVVRAASAEARAEGVTRGMRRREAEAQCPGVVCIDTDEALEARAFEVVARTIEVLTPRLVLDRPGLCSFITRGPSRYFGGDDALAVRVHEAIVTALGETEPGIRAHDVRIGIADGRFAARLATRKARAGEPFVVEPGGSAAFCAPWRVAVFEDEALESLLVRLGLRTLGDVAALPGDAVLARFGVDGRRFHDLARGIDTGPPVLVTPPPDLVEQVELDPPVQRVDAVAFAAKGLADRLLARLADRGLACTRVVIEAETEHGERLSRCWRNDGALTPAALAERVRWQLDGWLTATHGDHVDEDIEDTTGGLCLLRLIPDEVVPADGRQLGFWGGDQAAHDRADRALARVQGMVGFESVVTAVVQGGRTPAEQVRWVPWGEAREPQRPLVVDTFPTAWPGSLPPPFPARVFDPPAPAQLCDERGNAVVVSGRGEQSAAPAHVQCTVLPGGGGPISGWAGPWASDVRWWDPLARRRCARWQVVVNCGADSGDVACIVVVEAGRAGVEAIYD